MSNPKKVNDENEWPLGKLNPVTSATSGSKGRWRLKMSLKTNNKPVLLSPMAMTFSVKALFFLKKKK